MKAERNKPLRCVCSFQYDHSAERKLPTDVVARIRAVESCQRSLFDRICVEDEEQQQGKQGEQWEKNKEEEE